MSEIESPREYISDTETISSGSLNMYGELISFETTSSDEEENKKNSVPLLLIRNEARPSWDEYFREIVTVTSRRSSCDRLKVGCILVKDNRIISQGYNGFLPGCPHRSIMRDGHEQATVHAEQNALCDCAKRGVSCNESTAYITHYPCVICTRLMLASGISQINYLTDYRNDKLVELLCMQKGVCIEKLM